MTENTQNSKELKREVLGVWELAAYSMAANAPIAVAVLYFTGVAGIAGGSLPLVTILSGLLYLTTIIVIYQWSKEVASAYGYVAMIKKGLNSSLAAFVAGYGYIYQYWVAGAAGFGVLGVSSFLYLINPSYESTMPWLWAVLVILVSVIVGLAMWFGVKIGGRASLVLSLASIISLLTTSIYLIIKAGSANTLAVFTPEPLKWNWTPVMVSMILGASIFGGLTTSVGVAEEGKAPKQTLKKALILAWVLVAITLILSAYAQTIIYGPSNMFNYATLPDPLIIIYSKYFGPIVTAIIATLVAIAFVTSTISFATSGSRLAYGMARDHVLYPSQFTKINKYGVPGNSIILTTAIVMILSLVFGFLLGPFEAALFLLTFGSFFIYLGHIFAALSLIAYDIRHKLRKIVLNIVIPIISMILYILVLYYATYPAPPYPLDIAVFAAWAVVLIHIIVYYILKRRNPEIMKKFGDYSL